MKMTLQETAAKILSADSFIITSHVNPDGDAIGSCLALYQILRKLGKKAEILIADDVPWMFNFLPDVGAIKKPAEEAYVADFLLILDANKDRVGSVVEKCAAPILNIDHHVTNRGEADFLYLDADRAATAEIIYQLAQELAVEPDKEVALCIYTGIATDTGNFKFSNTTPFTMRAAADMLEAGASANLVSEAVEQRTFKEVVDKARVMQMAELALDGKVAGLYLDHALCTGLDTTEGFVDGIRIISGIDVAVLVREVEPAKCRVSMRSKGVDVSKVAASFRGGGHVRAAGCTIYKPLAEAKEELLAALAKAL